MSSHGVRAAWPLLVVTAILLLPRPASAQVSFWDKARDPELAKAEQVLHQAERMLLKAREAQQYAPELQAHFDGYALGLLERQGSDKLPDVRLKFLLGDLLVDSGVGRYDEAVRLLRRALAEAPDHPLAGQAWFDIAIAEAKLHKPKLEIDAYGHALGLTWQHQVRANIYMNRGESKMVMGHLEPALADYRRAIELAREPSLLALAYYGLGITLERSGDLPSALDAMHKGNAIVVPRSPTGCALDLDTVFFVPEYDLYYYKALRWMAYARDARAPSKKAERLERAIAFWKRYLTPAEPAHQPWVQHAKLLLDSCQRKLAKATVEAKHSRRKRRAHHH